jgi:hypothetical protein
MHYHVTYRLIHPEYLPTTSHDMIEAHSHRQLDAALARLQARWEAQGYTVQILAVREHHSAGDIGGNQ